MGRRTWAALVVVAIVGITGAETPALAQSKMLVYAHRGGAYEFEENTMEGFRSSYEKGLRGFETDARMTKDGALVILHDDTLERTHDGTGAVEHKTAAELRNIKTKKGQPLLFLDELLAYFADKPGVYLEVEMKTRNKALYPDDRLEEYCRKVHDAVEARRPRGSLYVLTSFDERPIKIVKRLDPSAELILITGGACTPKFIKQAQALGVKRIACRMEGTSRASISEAHKAGLLVNGWPGHTLQDYHLAVGLGVDAFCTDIPVAIQAWRARAE